MATQKGLFPELESTEAPTMPSGFRYQEDIISEADEATLVALLATLELKPFEFYGHVGNRRVTSFGLRYDYARRTVEPTKKFPLFIEELRRKVAAFAGINIEEIQQGGVNEYPLGAGIGWHKDKPQFGVVVGNLAFGARNHAPSNSQGDELDSQVPKHSNHDRSISWKEKLECGGSIVFHPSSRCDTRLRSEL